MFPLVEGVLKFIKKYGSYGPNKLACIFGPWCTYL